MCGFSQTAELLLQLSMRQGEHDALARLLEYVQQPKSDKGNHLKPAHDR